MAFLLVSPRPVPAIAAVEHGDFMHATGLDATELGQLQVDSTDVVLPPLDDIEGILVGGSPYNVLTPTPTAEQRYAQDFIDQLVDLPLPTLFVCFGHSLIALRRGGHINTNYAENSGATTVVLTEAGLDDPLTSSLPQSFTALTGHTENIDVVAPGSVVLATGPTCPIQIARVSETTWSTQFHPEMDPAAMAQRMDFYRSNGYFPPADYDRIVASIKDIDTTASHQVLRNFIQYCRTR